MNPRITSVVLSSNGKKATVTGPINWDDDETSAKFSAAVAQVDGSGNTVVAMGQNTDTTYTNPTDQTWQAEVKTRTGEQLVAGKVNGWAAAAVLDTSNAYECYSCQKKRVSV
jgi:hypothetical protein